MPLPFTPPRLPTLRLRPSWLNNNNRLDRGACVEVRLSEIRRLAGCVRFQPQIWPDMDKVRLPVQPLPNERPALNKHGRISTGVFTITARQLHQLQDHRLPRQMAGDRRTKRAGAMRPFYYKDGDVFHFRVKRNDGPQLVTFDRGLDANPNRGATRTKMLGITEYWSQQLRIEKWIFPKRIQPAYYLICPGFASVRRGSHSSSPGRDGREALAVRGYSYPAPPIAAAPLSTCPAGRKPPKPDRNGKYECPQRCLKLLMIQCTPQEFADAEAALMWMASIPQPYLATMRPHINELLLRYGPILPPRMLLCPRCLGVRYGNDPENARQSWRRKQGKENALPAKRKVTKSNNAKWAKDMRRRRKRLRDTNP